MDNTVACQPQVGSGLTGMSIPEMMPVLLRLPGRPIQSLPLHARADPALSRKAVRPVARPHRSACRHAQRAIQPARQCRPRPTRQRNRCSAGSCCPRAPATASTGFECPPRAGGITHPLSLERSGCAVAGAGRDPARTVTPCQPPGAQGRTDAGRSRCRGADQPPAARRSPAVSTTGPPAGLRAYHSENWRERVGSL